MGVSLEAGTAALPHTPQMPPITRSTASNPSAAASRRRTKVVADAPSPAVFVMFTPVHDVFDLSDLRMPAGWWCVGGGSTEPFARDPHTGEPKAPNTYRLKRELQFTGPRGGIARAMDVLTAKFRELRAAGTVAAFKVDDKFSPE